ncbi:MAG: hypothetical protein FJ333_00105 [Sphingomonadales bacterium]|nr:hypothetical protein [Sphingomonadales bacterium]
MAKIDSEPNKPTNSDYYFENGFLVFTREYHVKRGFCCGNGCRHCPYIPKHGKGSKNLAPKSSH